MINPRTKKSWLL